MKHTSLRLSGLALGIAAAIAVTPAVVASAATSYIQLTPSDANRGQRLGESVAQSSDGQVTVAGSIARNTGAGAESGRVYVYLGRSGTDTLPRAEDAQLAPTPGIDIRTDDRFGSSVDVSSNGDTIVVGASNYSVGLGTVYVFQRTDTSSWEQTARISAPAGANGGGFGTAVAISDDGSRIVAGAPASLSSTAQGAAAYYVLENGTWTLKTVVAGGAAGSLGGTDVEISADGSRVAVGAPTSKVSGTPAAGRVNTYAAAATGLTALGTITDPSTASSGTSGAYFGAGALSFTADNNGLLVGAPFATAAAGVSGSTVGGVGYYYRYSGSWARSATFAASSTASARLGYAGGISPDGTKIVLGAPYYNGTTGGRVFTAQKTGSLWSSLTAAGPTGNNSSARVGWSTSFGSNNRFTVGAPLQNDSSGTQTGLAWVVDIS